MSKTVSGTRTQAVKSETRGRIQVIARVARILRCLEGVSDGLSLGQIAERVELPRSTVQRIIATLDEEGFVASASPQGGVRLGPALMRMAAAARSDLVGIVHPFVEALSRELDETVDLSVMSGANAVFVDQVVSANRRLRAVSGVGAEFPSFSCAPGKAMLAQLDADDARDIIIGKLKPLTENTITDVNVLFKELEQIKREGVAYDREEHTDGISAVGAAISDAYGNLAAISVPMPTQRFRERKRGHYRSALLAYCKKINAALGGRQNT
ncbi:MAG: IclR family transcriptional regulator [Rhodospirillales bacterium]|nr:IclR family transcriptional regulator [Rhodospirillales bacterium]